MIRIGVSSVSDDFEDTCIGITDANRCWCYPSRWCIIDSQRRACAASRRAAGLRPERESGRTRVYVHTFIYIYDFILRDASAYDIRFRELRDREQLSNHRLSSINPSKFSKNRFPLKCFKSYVLISFAIF